MLPGDDLAAMQMSGEHEVIAGVTGRVPDSRVVRAQDADIAINRRRGFRTGQRDHPPPMRHPSDAVMDPTPAAAFHGRANVVHADQPVMVAANGEHGRNVAKRANQLAQPAQLGTTVYEVASEQHRIRVGASRGIQHLTSERD